MSNERMTITVSGYSIELDESILAKLMLLTECSYMREDLERIISKFIELYQGEYDFGDIIPAEECMRYISTLHEVKKDYHFLTGLKVKKAEAPTAE